MAKLYSYKRIIKESFPILVVVLMLSITSGSVLDHAEDMLLTIPAFLIAIPAFANQAGDLAAVFFARFTTELRTGTIPSKFSFSSTFKGDFMGIFITACIGFTFLSISISIISFVAGIPSMEPLIQWFIIFVSGVLTVIILIFAGIPVALISTKKGLDPDNFMSPILTTLGDVVGMLLLVGLIIII